MKKTICFNIPLGFKVIEKIENMNVWQAEERLLTKRYKRYIKAIRSGDKVSLYARYLICPYCGKEFAVNSNSEIFIRNDEEYLRYYRHIPKAAFKEWATKQISLFEDELNKELVISSCIEPPPQFYCPSCDRLSTASSSDRKVELTLDRKKIFVKCEIAEIDELLSLEWIKAKELHLSFPIFEVVTFDLSRGRVSVKIEDVHGTPLCCRDITSIPELLYGGAVYKMLDSNKLVLRNLKRLFKEVWKVELPYVGKQLDLFSLFKMTMFVGYPSSFYVCIPFVQGSFSVEKSFRRIAHRLHFSRNIDQVYCRMGLPQIKSVRRIIFENPGLLFYANEVCDIWNAIKDCNLLCRFLKGERAYEILSAIHMRPGILEYITDYCSVKGSIELVLALEKNWGYIREQAIDYSCMSARMRAMLQESWKKKNNKNCDAIHMLTYSLPMRCPEESIKDCTINGYYFFWLRSSNDYMRAASLLKNCLNEWQPYYSPVVCVRKNDKLVASIELRGKRVVQARGFKNQSIEDDENLNEAFQKWMKRYSLEWFDNLGDYEDDDIPIEYFEDAEVSF